MTEHSKIPFAEPPWLNGLPSPYYNESHRKWQKTCRAFIGENLIKHAAEWDAEGQLPDSVFQKFAEHNFLVPSLPAPLPIKWLKRLGIHEVPGGIKIEDYDYLHNVIYLDEMSRSGLAGPPGSLTTGISLGIPSILKYGSQELQERILPDLILARKRTCLAITEPDAGSDVANLTTTAVRSKDGKHFIVNGTKKWITNGIWAANSIMAVRTGGPGASGLSLMVVPLKGHPGVTMRRIKVSGQISSGTTFIELDNVKIPAENIIGEEGMGMKYVMTNFNHERMAMAIGATRQARVALSAAFEYCLKREAFGKTLMEQPVVRQRLSRAGAQLEAQWAWIEQFAYSILKLPKTEADVQLGGLTAAAKAQAGVILGECARCAVLLFGGNGFTKTGQGAIAEMLYREVPGLQIPGGSEDVMYDLAVRQLVKNYKNETKTMERPRQSSRI